MNIEEILNYLQNIKSKLNSSLNLKEIISSNEDLVLKYPDLFYFTALNLSYNQKRELKEITETIEYIINNKDRFKCPTHLYFTIIYNLISNINKQLINYSYYSELNYNDLKIFFEILPSIFYSHFKDTYIEKVLKLIEQIPYLIETNKKEFKQTYNYYEQLIKQSIEKIKEIISNQPNKNFQNNVKKKYYFNPVISKNNDNKNDNSKEKKYIKKIINPPKKFIKPNFIDSISAIQKIEDDNNKSDSVEEIVDQIFDVKPIEKELNQSLVNEGAESIYNRLSIDKIKIQCYNDDNYFLELIGSYSLSTLKNKDSSIDFVFMIKNENKINYINKNEIKNWINDKNSKNFSLIDIEEHRGRILFYKLYNFEGIDHIEKDVNIYLFCNKYIECNNIFKKIFKDNKNMGILYSFFYLPLINVGLEIGSQICFLIVAFLDINYKIFHTKEKEKIVKNSYEYIEKKETIEKKIYYYYQLNEKELKQVGKKKYGILIYEFNEFLIKLINKSIEIPDRLNDTKYLFRIKFFFDLLLSNNIQDSILHKIKKEIYSFITYKDFCNKIGIKYDLED